MTFRVNGVQIMTGSANTQSNLNQLLLQTPTANNHAFLAVGVNGPSLACDFLFIRCDGTGLVNKFAGDVEISAVFPDADITTQWSSTGTPHYSQINEHIPDGDSSYISSNTAGQVDAFNFQPLSPFTGTVIGIHYLAFARKDDEGSRTFTLLVSGVEPVGCPAFSPSDDYIYFTFAMDADPDTGAAWTPTSFNSKVFGVKLLS